ncbi:retrovirus-related pol polyprotein from transposon TNT 1-94 [Tanacetum coccineum]
MVPRTVLTRSGPISINTARPVNNVQPRTAVNNAGPMKNVINNAYSTARRPFNKITAANNSNFTKKVNIIKDTRVNTARPKAVLSAVKGNKGNAVKASACWILRPKHKVLDHVSRNNGASMSFKRFDYIDAQGRSKHMTGNISYLTDYEEIDGGFVAFGDFKLTDESYVLLKVPRKDNMYNVDLKNLKGKNKTLIEAARTMLADSKLSTTFWAKAVNTACYVQNKVLVIKPHNKTPFEIFLGRKPALSFMRPFGCPVTILNTIDHLGKFDGKADEGFFVGYSTNSKAFRVFNSRTRIVEENLHVQFSENTSNIAGCGPNWLFDIDALTNSMNYKPVVAGNQSNDNVGTKACADTSKARVETVPGKDYILLPLWTQDPSLSSCPKDSSDAGFKPSGEEEKKDAKDLRNESGNLTKGKYSEVPKSMQDELLQFKLQKVWALVDLPNGKRAIGTKWVYRNKKDERGIVIKNKARLVAQGYTQEEGIDYDEMDVKSAFLYGLQVKQKKDGIFISQDMYVTEILNKFGFSDVKTVNTPMETHEPLLKDADGEDVDEHIYRSMIGSLMYLTSSRPYIMFVVCVCAHDGFSKVTLKLSHLYAVKRIFRYLKGQPKLGLWYPKHLPFDLVAYTDSDYARASLDRNSTTRGCQFLGCRLISWQCKNQTVVANSTTG